MDLLAKLEAIGISTSGKEPLTGKEIGAVVLLLSANGIKAPELDIIENTLRGYPQFYVSDKKGRKSAQELADSDLTWPEALIPVEDLPLGKEIKHWLYIKANAAAMANGYPDMTAIKGGDLGETELSAKAKAGIIGMILIVAVLAIFGSK